ncbi:unnamed protein product [Boreogadus saida]
MLGSVVSDLQQHMVGTCSVGEALLASSALGQMVAHRASKRTSDAPGCVFCWVLSPLMACSQPGRRAWWTQCRSS